MYRLTIVLLVCFSYSGSFCQTDVTGYYRMANAYLETRFHPKLQGQYYLKSFFAKTNEEGYWHFDSGQLASNTITDFVSLTFKYGFFSTRLNSQLNFELTVKKDSTIDDAIPLSSYLPDCVLQDTVCDFLTKDQALAIVIKRDIRYTVDFDIEFVRPLNQPDYFWLIMGYDRKLNRQSNDGANFSDGQLTIINARTGEVISYTDYRDLSE